MNLSFMTANYVARPVNYHMTEGWMQGDNATNAFFRPIETFPERFDTYMADVRALGFDYVDIWLAILHPQWATEAHTDAARESLDRHGLTPVSLAGAFGDTPDDFEKSCELASALDVQILGGMTGLLTSDYQALADLLAKYDLRFGYENHPEKSPEEVLAKIGFSDYIGTAVDTGWYGTHGYNAAQAIEALKDRLVYVHLKDVRAAGGHETCQFGDGVVPVRECVEVLQRIGYDGPVSVEHEPDLYDPSDEVRASADMLRAWLA
ncbi:MAG: hypothetical protein OHK0046_49620 [Anaerolineae bacterium]